MIEKFSDFEGTKYIDKEGTFIFTVKEAELTASSTGNQMIKMIVEATEGQSTLYFSLNPKARWKYNKFITACLELTDEAKKTFELDYEVIHNDLIGKTFAGTVEEDTYEKSVAQPDGTFRTEPRTSYKIVDFDSANTPF